MIKEDRYEKVSFCLPTDCILSIILCSKYGLSLIHIFFIFVKQLNRFVLFLSLWRPPIPSVRKGAGDKWRSSASAFAARTSGNR